MNVLSPSFPDNLMKVQPKYVKQGVIQNANLPIAFLIADAFIVSGSYFEQIRQ